MKMLASEIAKALENSGSAVSTNPNCRAFGRLTVSRVKPKIAAFAELHGWRLRYYKEGFCAIFDKDPNR